MSDDRVARAKPIVDAAIGSLCTACVVLVEHRGRQQVYAAGRLDPSAATSREVGQWPANAHDDALCSPTTVFDLASLTKLATTALCLAFVHDRVLDLEMPLREIVPDFRGPGKDAVTLKHVLTHTAGLLWWKPLYQEVTSAEEAVWLAAQEPLAHELGTFVYSDLGYIMLTAGLAHAGDAPLSELLAERVLEVLDTASLSYGPRPPALCAATEVDDKWRHRRLRGEVHDENAFAMGGVAGHAGLFGTAADVAALARVFKDGAVIGNELAALARRQHAVGDNARRGLGLALRAPQGAMCGRYFSESAWGHSGFTGTSLWVDPDLDLLVVILTNRVYFGRDNADALYRFRIAVHEALSADPAKTS